MTTSPTAKLLAWLKRRTLKQLAIGATAALFFGAGLLIAPNLYMLHRAKPLSFGHEQLQDVPNAYVAIVLGARVRSDGEPSSALSARLNSALELYQAGKVKRILVTGDHGRQGYDEVRAMFTWLNARGVPRRDIFLDHAGFRTLDSMQRAKAIFKVQDAIICTQDFHMARSLFLAQTAGLKVYGLSSDPSTYAPARRILVRETLARSWAFLDVYVFAMPPDHWGEEISIYGLSEPSYDF